MIYRWLCKRREFVDFIVNRKPLNIGVVQGTEGFMPSQIGKEEVLLIWDRQPGDTFSLPNVVVVDEREMSDFHAWLASYFRQIRPFTAQCRVLTPNLVALLIKNDQSTSLNEVSQAVVGLILAEGVVYSVGRTDPGRLPFSAFTRTLSFALMKGAQLYGKNFTNKIIFDQIRNGWIAARELSNQPSLGLSSSVISDILAITLRAVEDADINPSRSNSESLLNESLKTLKLSGHISNAILNEISTTCKKTGLQLDEMDGPRETRVKAVESSLRDLIRGSDETRMLRAFIAGYMISRVQPGSIEHFSLLFPAIEELPESFLWYGVCAGLSPENSIDFYGNGLGWYIKREFGRVSHWLNRPDCDIALSEMMVLFRNFEDSNLNIRTVMAGALEIEIFPMICTTVKWAEYGDSYSSQKYVSTGYQKELFEEDSQVKQDVFEILAKIQESTNTLNLIRKQVEMRFSERSTRGSKWRK